MQVIDSDAVMVLEAGKLLEMDTPAALMRKPGGYFAAMCAEYGEEMEAELKKQAEAVRFARFCRPHLRPFIFGLI